jgi:transaldolase
MEPDRERLSIRIFADGADFNGMLEMADKPFISGLTTNPTLMRRAGIVDYVKFAKDVLREIQVKPISFEVFSDDLNEMKTQAAKIATFGENVYVKVPITNSQGRSTNEVIEFLVNEGVKVNVTALMTQKQCSQVAEVLDPNVPSFVSVFAGRIADTGRDPLPIMEQCLDVLALNRKSQLIWASPRELLNIFQADEIGCHIITATNDILKKMDLIGYDLTAYSLETVNMFYRDANAAGYKI